MIVLHLITKRKLILEAAFGRWVIEKPTACNKTMKYQSQGVTDGFGMCNSALGGLTMATWYVQGVKVAIPKSAAASLEALANFALDGCEEPFGAGGDAYDTASTAVKNPFGGGDVLVRTCPLRHQH